jgi:hypothetical protein
MSTAREMSKYRDQLVKARHDASQDYDRAVLTLTSATLALSVTFLHDIAPQPKPGSNALLLLSWVLLGAGLIATFVSLLTSQWALRQAIADVDAGKTDKLQHPGGRLAFATEVLNVVAGIGFVVGLVFLAGFAFVNM